MRTPEAVKAVVELRSVHKSFKEGDSRRTVLAEVDLKLHPGELFMLVGKSGSGKSTLLNLVSGIDLPDGGEIHVAGQIINALSERDRTLLRRRHLGFIFQAFNLIQTLTVLENVELPLQLAGGAKQEDERRARSLLEEVGLWDRRDDPPDKLSGGEQQRVAVARALVHDPALILADEPTGNLDDETGEAVFALLERMCRQHGKTLLVVTHDRTVLARADRGYELVHGHLQALIKKDGPG